MSRTRSLAACAQQLTPDRNQLLWFWLNLTAASLSFLLIVTVVGDSHPAALWIPHSKLLPSDWADHCFLTYNLSTSALWLVEVRRVRRSTNAGRRVAMFTPAAVAAAAAAA